jgi:phosphohistidine phosphatase SixA
MTDTVLYPSSLAQEANTVSEALRELGTATRRLVAAVFQTVVRARPIAQVVTAQQEADKLRAYADTLYRNDPRFADDLYAAATRHEMAAQTE